ncbi:MAG: hypothetical protein ABGX72_06220 [Methyloprofundus sp.]
MDYKTPNIDRIANECMMLTDDYAEHRWNGTWMHFHTHVKKNYAVSPVRMSTVMVWLSMIVISVYF